jgi:poly-beta-1,6-N-acetyl-D-glucosamine synthase
MLVLGFAAVIVLGFTWGGYPLLMRGLARAQARRSGQRRAVDDELPPEPIVVLIASREGPVEIADRVRNVRNSLWPSDMLRVVVSLDVGALPQGPSGPAALAAIAAAESELAGEAEVIPGDAPGGKASALNAGMRAIDTGIVVLTDTGQRFEPETIPTLIHALRRDTRLGAVSGALLTSSAGRRRGAVDLYWRLEKLLRRDEAIVHSTVGVTGAVYAVRRALYPQLPDGLILDDLFVPMTIVLGGHRVGFVESAIATDTRRFTTEQEYRRKVRTLTGVWQLCAWLPAVLVPGRNPIWGQFVAHKLLRLATPYLALAAVVALAALIVPVVHARAPWALPAAIAVAVAAMLAPGIGARVRNLLHSLLAMQAAIVMATVNGVRGRWAVWS